MTGTIHSFGLPSLALVDSVDLVDLAVSRILATHKVSNQEKQIKEDVECIADAVRKFNTLREDAYEVDGVPLEKIPILDEFKDFILPNSVRYDSSYRAFPDLLKRNTDLAAGDTYKFNDIEYKNACDRLRTYCKSDMKSRVSTLADVRVNKSLSDVFPYIVHDGLVRMTEHGFVPIELKGIQGLVDGGYWLGSEVANCIKDYMAYWTP